MTRELDKRLERVEQKVDKILNNDLLHLKEKVATIDGKLWVVLMALSGIILATVFGK